MKLKNVEPVLVRVYSNGEREKEWIHPDIISKLEWQDNYISTSPLIRIELSENNDGKNFCHIFALVKDVDALKKHSEEDISDFHYELYNNLKKSLVDIAHVDNYDTIGVLSWYVKLEQENGEIFEWMSQ